MFNKLINSKMAHKQAERRAQLYRKLMRHEAKIGGQVFGPSPPGGQREFFCLDKNTWVWHEEWIGSNGQRQIKTTRYDVRPNIILKSQDGQDEPIGREEAAHLIQATHLYRDRVNAELYAAV